LLHSIQQKSAKNIEDTFVHIRRKDMNDMTEGTLFLAGITKNWQAAYLELLSFFTLLLR
jgi:hypothetical protein